MHKITPPCPSPLSLPAEAGKGRVIECCIKRKIYQLISAILTPSPFQGEGWGEVTKKNICHSLLIKKDFIFSESNWIESLIERKFTVIFLLVTPSLTRRGWGVVWFKIKNPGQAGVL